MAMSALTATELNKLWEDTKDKLAASMRLRLDELAHMKANPPVHVHVGSGAGGAGGACGGGAGGAGSFGVIPPPHNTPFLNKYAQDCNATKPSTMSPGELINMIASRLRVKRDDGFDISSRIGFDHIYAADLGEKVAVFVCQKGNHVVLEDGAELFPSDQLMTQLRLIRDQK